MSFCLQAFHIEVYSTDWSRDDFLATACGDDHIRVFRAEECSCVWDVC